MEISKTSNKIGHTENTRSSRDRRVAVGNCTTTRDRSDGDVDHAVADRHVRERCNDARERVVLIGEGVLNTRAIAERSACAELIPQQALWIGRVTTLLTLGHAGVRRSGRNERVSGADRATLLTKSARVNRTSACNTSSLAGLRLLGTKTALQADGLQDLRRVLTGRAIVALCKTSDRAI